MQLLLPCQKFYARSPEFLAQSPNIFIKLYVPLDYSEIAVQCKRNRRDFQNTYAILKNLHFFNISKGGKSAVELVFKMVFFPPILRFYKNIDAF